jgi:transcriptional regulator with XRE-family HTH domain
MVKHKRGTGERASPGLMSARIRHARRLIGLSQSALAKTLGVGPSAVAQWELPTGTSPTLGHLTEIAKVAGISFEWLATGRGPIALDRDDERKGDAGESTDGVTDRAEDRLLSAFRRVPNRKREAILRWIEDFF